MRILPSLFASFAFMGLAFSGCKSSQRYDAHGLRSVEIRMSPEEAGELYGGAYGHVPFPAEALIDGAEQRAEISAAGSSTVRTSRKSFNLELKGDGYRGAREIRLGANVSDPSMLRSLLALEVFNAAGVTASWIEPAFAYLNDRVLGLYVLIERVDEDYFRNRGIIWRRLFVAEGDADFGPTFEGRIDTAFSGKPKPANLSAMIALRRTLEIADPTAFEEAVFEILDRPNIVAYMAGAQILNHFDGFNKNLYYYQLEGSNLIRVAPWDFDLIWMADRAGNTETWSLNALFARIGKITSVRAEISGKVTALRSGYASTANVQTRIDFWKTRIANGYANDPRLGKSGRSLEQEAATLSSAAADWLSRVN